MSLDCSEEEALGIYNAWWEAREGYKNWVNEMFQVFKIKKYSTSVGGLPILAEYTEDLEGIETLLDLFNEVNLQRRQGNKERADYLNLKVLKSFRTFINFHGQASAVLTNLGMCRLMRWRKENSLNFKCVNTIHDDLVVEVPLQDLDLIWKKQKEFMTIPYLPDQTIQMRTEAEVGYNLQYEVGKYEREGRLEILQKLNIN
jgi:DNA polymerase I-like protein with 3'-5' exonuclease and polymerase domains